MPFVCCFFLCLLSRLSRVSVVFDFNASLSDFAPVSPMPVPICLIIIEKSGLLMDVLCVAFLCSPHRLSSVSVVFDFNASLNDAAPVSLILFPVGLIRMKKE